jgi:hypothetical protein
MEKEIFEKEIKNKLENESDKKNTSEFFYKNLLNLVLTPNFSIINQIYLDFKLTNPKQGDFHHFIYKSYDNYIYYSLSNEYWLVSSQKNNSLYLMKL